MAISYMDYTAPTVQFFSDVNKNRLFTGDNQNVINSLGRNLLNTLGNVSLLDIYLSRAKVVEPHIHQNASELVYCISGAAVVSFINPFTNKLINIPITPGQVANIPQAWWHYEIATEDNTHLLAIFDAPYPEVILGSDILRLTPPNIWAHTYCLDEDQWKQAVAPITQTVYIGPPTNCNRNTNVSMPNTNQHAITQQPQNPYNRNYHYYSSEFNQNQHPPGPPYSSN